MLIIQPAFDVMHMKRAGLGHGVVLRRGFWKEIGPLGRQIKRKIPALLKTTGNKLRQGKKRIKRDRWI
jgi:hypothetical protein